MPDTGSRKVVVNVSTPGAALNEEHRRESTVTILSWLAECCGEDVADTWAWLHTPMPCGLPLDPHLEEGLRWAAAGREAAMPMMHAALAEVHRRLDEAMASRVRTA